MFVRRERKLGVAEGKRVYDLPLNTGQGTGFLILLITLMTFLAIMALAGSFSLGAIAERWTSGLENKLTIEIRSEDRDGNLIAAGEIRAQAKEIAAILNRNTHVKAVDVLSQEEITELLSPWLGEDITLQDIPLPGILSVQLNNSNPETLKLLDDSVKTIAPTARLDTHETWLSDLLKLTGALQFSAIAVTFIIGVTTIAAIAGAIRSRMAVHKAEVELLHLMGARDDYITKQFQRHAFVLTLQGSAIGTVIGFLSLIILWMITGGSSEQIIPQLSISPAQAGILLMTPVFVCFIAVITARSTVLRVLAQMP